MSETHSKQYFVVPVGYIRINLYNAYIFQSAVPRAVTHTVS